MVVVRQVRGETIGAAVDPWVADLRTGTARVAADRITGESPQVKAGCSYPAAALAGAAMADAAATGSAGTEADYDAVANAVVGGLCVVIAMAVAVAVPDVVVFSKMLPTLPDSAATPGIGVVGAVELLEHSRPVQTPAATAEIVQM